MTIPTASAYPAALDSDNTLFGDLIDQGEFTLTNSILAGDTSFIVDEVITSITVPCFFAFHTGEIVYVEAKNNTNKTFSSVTRGAVPAPHTSGEKVRLTIVKNYIMQIKKAIIAIETELGTDPAGAQTDVCTRLGTYDTFIGTKAQPSGLASLDANSKVVQNPASRGVASGVASLNASALVVENPANASATPGAWTIPISDAGSKLDGWVTQNKAVSAQIWLPASAITPRTTGGCAYPVQYETATYQNFKFADFDKDTAEYGTFPIVLPDDWNAGTITAKFYWTCATGSTNAVIWGIRMESVGDTEAVNQSAGTAQTVSDAGNASAYYLCISAATSAITVAGSPAAGHLVHVTVYRDAAAGGDTLAYDARLIGVMLSYTRA